MLDEPTDLPEGTVIGLVVDDESDTLSDDELHDLNERIAAADRSIRDGGGVDAAVLLDKLRARST